MKIKHKANKLLEEAASQWLQIVLMNIKHNKQQKGIENKKDTRIK
jgi:hypothetical protein